MIGRALADCGSWLGLRSFPQAKVAVFVGTEFDPDQWTRRE